jgi:hypothetical protein
MAVFVFKHKITGNEYFAQAANTNHTVVGDAMAKLT